MIINSTNRKDTIKIGKKIAASLMPSDIICLSGQLGSGKTVLTKGIAEGLGIKSAEVTSPSFVLMRSLRGKRLTLYHFDLYRLKYAREIAALGYEEYLFNDAVTVIEWAERLGCLMPREFLKIELSLGRKTTQRCLKFSAYGARYKKLLESLSLPRPSYRVRGSNLEGRAG